MIDFKITPINGKFHEKHFVVYDKNQLTDDWIFIQSFLSKQNVLDFIYFVKRRIKRGEFDFLSLKN